MPIIKSGYRADRAARRAQYDSPIHRRTRRQLAPVVNAGHARCSRCQLPIRPGEQWDLDHTDDRTGYLGPSHAVCNRGGTYTLETQ